ncbi:MAG: hypothetical protein F6K61_11995 [Sphaerospermopsis sp. SIO1G1]|nr:hypothetical protein [Sphaerospermopsis sp. SIO1G1]
MKYFAIIVVLILSFSWTFPASAMVCRKYKDQEICILSIKRSAKKYWEYRASVSINGVKTPVEIYNCRGKFKVNQDRTISQFKENSAGEVICSFFDK